MKVRPKILVWNSLEKEKFSFLLHLNLRRYWSYSYNSSLVSERSLIMESCGCFSYMNQHFQLDISHLPWKAYSSGDVRGLKSLYFNQETSIRILTLLLSSFVSEPTALFSRPECKMWKSDETFSPIASSSIILWSSSYVNMWLKRPRQALKFSRIRTHEVCLPSAVCAGGARTHLHKCLF